MKNSNSPQNWSDHCTITLDYLESDYNAYISLKGKSISSTLHIQRLPGVRKNHADKCWQVPFGKFYFQLIERDLRFKVILNLSPALISKLHEAGIPVPFQYIHPKTAA